MDEANHNPNKIWLDKGNEVFKRSLKSWLHDNNIEMYLTHNEGNKYNNTYTTMAIEPVVLRSRIYIDFNKENNKEYPKFKVGYPVRI